jgi:hypothetical protein
MRKVLAAQVSPVVHRVSTGFLLRLAGSKAGEVDGGAIMPIPSFNGYERGADACGVHSHAVGAAGTHLRDPVVADRVFGTSQAIARR